METLTSVHVRLSPTLKKRLTDLAVGDDRNLSNFLRRELELLAVQKEAETKKR